VTTAERVLLAALACTFTLLYSLRRPDRFAIAEMIRVRRTHGYRQVFAERGWTLLRRSGQTP
jgi:hypothetical protein